MKTLFDSSQSLHTSPANGCRTINCLLCAVGGWFFIQISSNGTGRTAACTTCTPCTGATGTRAVQRTPRVATERWIRITHTMKTAQALLQTETPRVPLCHQPTTHNAPHRKTQNKMPRCCRARSPLRGAAFSLGAVVWLISTPPLTEMPPRNSVASTLAVRGSRSGQWFANISQYHHGFYPHPVYWDRVNEPRRVSEFRRAAQAHPHHELAAGAELHVTGSLLPSMRLR